MTTISSLPHFTRCLLREHVVTAMVRARLSKEQGWDAVTENVRIARTWNHKLVKALKGAPRL